MAQSSREGNLFEKARASMGAALESDWEWREGHEARLHLFHRFGRLEDLLVEYQTKDPAPGTIGAEMERIIRLAQEFSASPPSVATGLPDSADWKIWLQLFPLTVGIPLLAWGGLELSKALQDRGGQGQLYAFLTLMTVGAGILLLSLQILKILKGPKTARKRSGVHP
jgi:hypothetical protein